MPNQKDSGFKFILMRHSESAHNCKKVEYKNSHNDPNTSYKVSQEYLKTKFSKDFLDPNEIDKNLLEDSLRLLDIDQVGLIITSPLNRCLKTVEHILAFYSLRNQDKQKLPEVIVDPLITSRISTAWSVGTSLTEKKKAFPSFNFEQFPNQQRHWILSVLNPQLVETYKFSDKSTQSILQFISQENQETYKNIMKRIRKFKWKLQNKYLQMSKQKKILIISHNCLFKYVIGNQISHKGKVHSQIEFWHCDPIFFKEKFILEQTYLKPEQNGEQVEKKKQTQ